MDTSPANAGVAPPVQIFLWVLQIANPILLLFVYLISFTVRSIATARNDNDTSEQVPQLGPGGKPLPKKNTKEPARPDSLDFSKPRKLLFQWLTVGVIFSLLGNIIVVIVHALYDREQGWWCGQAPTVR